MFISNETKSDFLNVTQHLPVLALFYSHHCGACKKVYPDWDNFTHLYESDPEVVVAECDCVNHSEICSELGPIRSYPSFFIYLGGNRDQIQVDRTVAGFTAQVAELLAADPKFPCRRHWNQTGNFPYITFSFPDDDLTACTKLQSIATNISNFTSHLLLAKSNPESKIEVRLNSAYRFTRPGLPDQADQLAFVRDFSHHITGDWPLSESFQITFRRFAFVIFHEEWRIHRIESVFLGLGDVLCTGKLSLATFQEEYPDIQLKEADCPALAITNEDQSKFLVLKGLAAPEGLEDQVSAILNVSNHTDMIHNYKYFREMPRPNLPRNNQLQNIPEKNERRDIPQKKEIEKRPDEKKRENLAGRKERQFVEANAAARRTPFGEEPTRWSSVLPFLVVVAILLLCAVNQRRVRRIALSLKKGCFKLLARPAK
jgi:hypothetical protein